MNAARVILSMGGKGGVGKTRVMAGLAEWFDLNQIPVKMLDLDTENKARGSLTHFFRGRVPKVNIHTPAGLDSFIDQLADGPPVILADMGAGSGQVTYDWFDKMYADVSDAGIVFTAIGVVTSDPASVDSVLAQDSARSLYVYQQEFEVEGKRHTRKGFMARVRLEKFGEGIQQVELDVTDVDRATEILRTRFNLNSAYPATRAGANGTRVNFFLVTSRKGQKVLVELVEQPSISLRKEV